MGMSVEVHRADPKFRRLAPWVLVGTVIVGSIAIWALRLWLKSRLETAAGIEVDGIFMLAAGLVVVLATISLGLAFSLWQEAARIRSEDRFPPSDMRTLRDVPIRHGDDARRVAGWMRAGAVLALASGLGIVFWGYRLLQLVA
jgi:hypothetical protein